MDVDKETIERGLDAMIEQASLYGNVSDELLPYRAKIVAAYDAGASAQKIADYFSAALGKKISKDRILRFCERHGAKRKRPRRAADADPAAPVTHIPPAPRPPRRNRGATQSGENAAPPSTQIPDGTTILPGPSDPGPHAGRVRPFSRSRQTA